MKEKVMQDSFIDMDNIIFLDIDGPMIPATWLLQNVMASFDQDLDLRCVMVLKKIIEKTDAQIVFNTTHSSMLEKQEDSHGRVSWPGLIDQFIKAGLANDLHKSIATGFPDCAYTGYDHALFENIDYSECSTKHSSPDHHPRLGAILTWLKIHGTENTKWIALDDVYIPHDNAFTVSYDDGIGIDAYNFAMRKFEGKEFLCL